jgi:hypothetical protein
MIIVKNALIGLLLLLSWLRCFFFSPRKTLQGNARGASLLMLTITPHGDLNQAPVGTKLVKCLTTLTTIGWANPLGCFFLESCEEPKRCFSTLLVYSIVPHLGDPNWTLASMKLVKCSITLMITKWTYDQGVKPERLRFIVYFGDTSSTWIAQILCRFIETTWNFENYFISLKNEKKNVT